MSRVKNLARRNTNIPGWVPAVLVVAVIAWLSIRIAGSSDSNQQGRFGDFDSEDGATTDDGGREGDGGGSGGSGGDREVEGGVDGIPADVAREEMIDDDEDDEDADDFVVLSADEVGGRMSVVLVPSCFQSET